jgi:hypothetical protein
MMSCLVMRPPSPVPEIWERLTPCSRAILRTSGEERASSSSSGALGAGAGVAAGVDGTGAGFFSSLFSAAGFSGADAGLTAASPSTAMVPTMVFTFTVVPSVTLISWRMPEAGAGISASTLSVEISNRGSSR